MDVAALVAWVLTAGGGFVLFGTGGGLPPDLSPDAEEAGPWPASQT